MAKQKVQRYVNKNKSSQYVMATIFISILVCFGVVAFGFFGNIFESFFKGEITKEADFTNNDGLQRHVVEFLLNNEATALIPIIKCESEFKHFDESGGVLRNRKGSSALGVAQIMSSVHPDPQVLRRYNQRFGTSLSVRDFDITTVSGNLEYSLVLYKLRGVRDWECAKYI